MCGGDDSTQSSTNVDGVYETPAEFRGVEYSAAKDGDLVVAAFPLTFNGTSYQHARIVFIKGRAPAPVILVHHNYAGLKEFDVAQAAFLAKCGFVGLAVDCYPDDESGYSFETRSAPFGDGADSEARRSKHYRGAFNAMQSLLSSPREWRDLMSEYLRLAFEHPAVLSGEAGAIGYCLGGQSCLEQLRAGHALRAICTFHGLLHSKPLVKTGHGRTGYDDDAGIVRVSDAAFAALLAGQGVGSSHTPGCRVVIENGADDHHVPDADVLVWQVPRVKKLSAQTLAPERT